VQQQHAATGAYSGHADIARRFIHCAQSLFDPGGMRQAGDVALGEEALEIAEALHVFDDQAGIFRGAGEYLLEPFFLAADDVEQEVLVAVTQGCDVVIDVDLICGMAVSDGDRDVMQARTLVAYEGFSRRRQLQQMIGEIRVVAAVNTLAGLSSSLLWCTLLVTLVDEF